MTGPSKLLLVDSDGPRGAALAEQLRLQDDYAIAHAIDAAAALEAVEAEDFDVVLIDAGLSDLPGPELSHRLRQDRPDQPIVLLAGPETPPDDGASARITRPFRLAALIQLLRDQLLTPEPSEIDGVQIGPYRFDSAAKLLVDRSGARIRLTEKETAMLHYLYRAGDQATARDELLHEVWGYNPAVTTHTLETHVYRLRQKIETDPANAEILVTEPGGYRLVP